jgi:hypothetical protein
MMSLRSNCCSTNTKATSFAVGALYLPLCSSGGFLSACITTLNDSEGGILLMVNCWKIIGSQSGRWMK